MSYILDALKKSEQERGHGNIPSVQTVHTSSLNYKNKKTVWPYFLIAAVVLNLAAIAYFYLDKDKPSVTNTAAMTSDKESIQTITTDKDNPDDSTDHQVTVTSPVMSEAVTQDKTNPGSQPTAAREKTPLSPETTTINNTADVYSQPAAIESRAARTDNSDVVEFYDLPDSIKRQLPAIIVSAHVYSSNPLQRSIVINNNFLEEGEYVLDDLVLYEITSDGAIFSYHDTFFHHGVVNSWQ